MIEFKNMNEMVNYAKEKVLEYNSNYPNNPYLYFLFCYNLLENENYELIENIAEIKNEKQKFFIIKSRGEVKNNENTELMMNWAKYKDTIKQMFKGSFDFLANQQQQHWWVSTQSALHNDYNYYNPLYNLFY